MDSEKRKMQAERGAERNEIKDGRKEEKQKKEEKEQREEGRRERQGKERIEQN